jgi:hypothetical protein
VSNVCFWHKADILSHRRKAMSAFDPKRTCRSLPGLCLIVSLCGLGFVSRFFDLFNQVL